MSRPFRFKQFQIEQAVNPQKVGTDSMLLGAWIKGNFPRILDIGTGTGILALMQAQNHPNATVTAIEPDLASITEATHNFNNSPFHTRILPINVSIQQFGALAQFDLIITNPPYFENSFLSADVNRNRARHTDELPTHELYECASELLNNYGKLALIIPHEQEATHLKRAAETGLFAEKILRTKREDGTFKRSLIQFQLAATTTHITEMLVKDTNGNYSEAYISLTKEFYLKDLSSL